MLVSVTALGARADRTAGASQDTVNYLKGNGRLAAAGSKGPDAPAVSGQTSPGGYYADAPEQAGRWRGAGAEALGETVDAKTFTRALLGQNPQSGAQVVSPTGSAGRAGWTPQATIEGDPAELLSLSEAADLAGIDSSYLRRLARQTAISYRPWATSLPPS